MTRYQDQAGSFPDFSALEESSSEEPVSVEFAEAPKRRATADRSRSAKGPKRDPQAQQHPGPQKRRSRRPEDASPKRKQRGVVQQEPEEALEEEDIPWTEVVKNWLKGEGGAGYGISVLVHVVILLIMSFWILTRPSEDDLVITATETDIVDLAAMRDVDLVELDAEIESIKAPEFEPAPLSSPDLGVGSLALTATNTVGGGLDFKIPDSAVTKGSFSVWTEPKDPKPGEQYVIMIQIQLKNAVKRYPRRDLSGNVVGTDGYKEHFGGPTESGYIPVQGKTVRFQACRVPGAAMLVKDVITVESKILKEKQEIDLVF